MNHLIECMYGMLANFMMVHMNFGRYTNLVHIAIIVNGVGIDPVVNIVSTMNIIIT